MTTQQYKTEIQKAIDSLPESTLQQVLEYLNSLKGIASEDHATAKNLSKILQEDKELLTKLAQ